MDCGVGWGMASTLARSVIILALNFSRLWYYQTGSMNPFPVDDRVGPKAE